VYWEDSTIVPFFDASGKVSQFIAICSDITRRKLVEEALREGEERARLATAVAGVAVWAWDVQTGSIKWDELMFTLYGMQPTPDGCVSYTTWKATVFQDDLAEQVAVLERTAATGGSSQREFRIIRASDNAVRIMQAAEVMVEGVAGAANRLVGINIDITERRRGEEVIAKLNADLQRRSERLEEANKELEAFSYSVSHDLRAPLRAVDGFSKMVLDRYRGVLGEEGGRMLSIVRGETQRMGQLIDDLLAFCRIGRKAVESMEVDMHAMARAVFDELVQLEPERKLTLNLHPLPTVRGMPAMLRQVWVNLIGKAIKFTKERDVGLIEIDSRKGEDGELIYSVKDNGVGFDMRYAEKLFGVFQRLHAAHEFPCTGVGLAIAKRILQRHGGRIWVEAEIDKGAIFSFALPI
jgi:light-regulated signal transduction histidine kinase (bacteriophytochrome)